MFARSGITAGRTDYACLGAEWNYPGRRLAAGRFIFQDAAKLFSSSGS